LKSTRCPIMTQNGESSKKRKLPQDEDISFVYLTPEKLLVISSQELESRISELSNIRTLNSPEMKEVKRQIRLVKNREYAQSSRIKKKQHVEELEDENNALRERVQELEEENRKLKLILNPEYASHEIGTSPSFFTYSHPDLSPFSESIFDSDEMDQFLSSESSAHEYNEFPVKISFPELPSINSLSSSLSFSGSFTNTISLFMILFSFGLFLSSVPGILPPLTTTHQFPLFSQSFQDGPISRSLLSYSIDPDIGHSQVRTFQSIYVPRERISYYEVLLDEHNNTNVIEFNDVITS